MSDAQPQEAKPAAEVKDKAPAEPATEGPKLAVPKEKSQYDAKLCQDKLNTSMEEMFAAMGEYARAELSSATKDFALLRELNEAASRKYDAMSETATKLSVFLEDMQSHCLQNSCWRGWGVKVSSHNNGCAQTDKILEPYLTQVDEIDRELAELESNVQALDAYTKNLGLRHFEPQSNSEYKTTPPFHRNLHNRGALQEDLEGACQGMRRNRRARPPLLLPHTCSMENAVTRLPFLLFLCLTSSTPAPTQSS